MNKLSHFTKILIDFCIKMRKILIIRPQNGCKVCHKVEFLHNLAIFSEKNA